MRGLPKGVKQKITITCTVFGKKQVDAIVFGLLAVHKTDSYNGLYTITHLPTGFKTAALDGFHYVRDVAQLLAAGLRWDFKHISELLPEEREKTINALAIAMTPCRMPGASSEARECARAEALEKLSRLLFGNEGKQ